MALHLNLLHEELLEQRQRKRDPLKIGIIVLSGIGAICFLFYMWTAYRTLQIKGRLSVVQAQWAKVEPNVTAAQKKSTELNGIINTTRVLDDMIANRFFWAPFLDRVAHCVTPNAQLTSLEGALDANNNLTVSIEGLAAGREPRAVAEDLRQLLREQLSKMFPQVKVEFKSLEDIDTMVTIDGTSAPMVRYTLLVTCTTGAPAASPTPAATRRSKT